MTEIKWVTPYGNCGWVLVTKSFTNQFLCYTNTSFGELKNNFKDTVTREDCVLMAPENFIIKFHIYCDTELYNNIIQYCHKAVLLIELQHCPQWANRVSITTDKFIILHLPTCCYIFLVCCCCCCFCSVDQYITQFCPETPVLVLMQVL